MRAAAERYGVSPTTVQKWRGRETSADARMGPKEARFTVLSPEEEAIVVAFRRHILLPSDDCLDALQPSVEIAFVDQGYTGAKPATGARVEGGNTRDFPLHRRAQRS
ncbi:hypothetical protein MEX01_54220 [Methylorubrum extorquens]|nr:hypothetical protein MEX01_54220 [Methylorubrum extorquens]